MPGAGFDQEPGPCGQHVELNLWGEAPGGDALRFADRLAERAVVMPGTLVERPGHFRISLTASLEMVDRALPAFQDCGRGQDPLLRLRDIGGISCE